MGGGLVGWRGYYYYYYYYYWRGGGGGGETQREEVFSPLPAAWWMIQESLLHWVWVVELYAAAAHMFTYNTHVCVSHQAAHTHTHTHTPFYFEYHQLNEAWHTTTTSLPLSTLYHAGSFFLAAFKCPQYVTHACMNACIPANTRALCLCTHTHTHRGSKWSLLGHLFQTLFIALTCTVLLQRITA